MQIKKGQTFIVPELVNLEPGTNRFNWLHPGCTFVITKVGKQLIEWRYTDYGRFTGKLDSMLASRFIYRVGLDIFARV